MSFFSKNENFIRIKFHIDMRGMSLEEKIMYYNTNLKNDTLKRLKDYFKDLDEQLEKKLSNTESINLFTLNHNELEKKTIEYTEIIKLLKDYDFELILFSIYFENTGNQLFQNLKNILLENIPEKFVDKYLLVDSLKNNTFIKDEISIYLLKDKLELSKKDFEEEENDNRNPIISKLINYLETNSIVANSELEINLVLFHYAKYWNIKHAYPYNEKKGIILLHNIIHLLDNIDSKIKVDLYQTITYLRETLESLIHKVYLPPYLENENSNRIPILNGYLNNKNKLINKLKESSKHLINYEKLNLKELFIIYYDSNINLQKIIFEEIKAKCTIKYMPNNSEIAFFNEYCFTKNNDSQHLNIFFIKTNYLFYALI